MLLPESRNFVSKVLKRVHFFPDRYDIELELSAHIEDSALSLQEEEGLDQRDAQKRRLSEWVTPKKSEQLLIDSIIPS